MGGAMIVRGKILTGLASQFPTEVRDGKFAAFKSYLTSAIIL